MARGLPRQWATRAGLKSRAAWRASRHAHPLPLVIPRDVKRPRSFGRAHPSRQSSRGAPARKVRGPGAQSLRSGVRVKEEGGARVASRSSGEDTEVEREARRAAPVAPAFPLQAMPVKMFGRAGRGMRFVGLLVEH